MSYEGDSTATLDPVDEASDAGFLDQLAKKLNAAPVQTEPIDFDKMQELETRLADREQLVAILTERLEQAADELDRVKRTGGVVSKSANDDVDLTALVDRNNEVESKLDQFFSAWEERYEGPALRRMETRLEELREQLEQATTQGLMTNAGGVAAQFLSGQNIDLQNANTQSETDEDSDHESELEAEAGSYSRADSRNAPFQLVLISKDEVPDDLDVPLPEPIDHDDISEQALHQAVADRDTYITWLCHQMRQITGRLENWLSDLQVDSDNAALNERVNDLESMIRDQLRVAEVEVSIERAQLSRERAKLQEEASQMAREREQLAKSLQNSSDEDDTPMLRRWKKFLKPGDA